MIERFPGPRGEVTTRGLGPRPARASCVGSLPAGRAGASRVGSLPAGRAGASRVGSLPAGWAGASRVGSLPAGRWRFPSHVPPLLGFVLFAVAVLPGGSGAQSRDPRAVSAALARLGVTLDEHHQVDSTILADSLVVGRSSVAWLDENGDGRADEIEDAYLFELGFGGPDRLLDWQDLDGDGEADRQVLYSLEQGPLGPGLTAFVVEQRDVERDFWFPYRGHYHQAESQWRSDFHGRSFFTALRWDGAAERWVVFDESPFCFYDPDGDGLSEEALRFSGEDDRLTTLRWSFDTDDDAPGPAEREPWPVPLADGSLGAEAELVGATPGPGNVVVGSGRLTSTPLDRYAATLHDPPRLPSERYAHAYDYDLSLTAIGRVRVPPADLDTLTLRGGTEARLLSYDRAREFAASARWMRWLLAFDEDDRNVDPDDPEHRGRWEGVIAHSPGGFPGVGGPDCGRMNKRYEVLNVPGLPELYFHPVDGRIHLRGASGWIEIDRDGDGYVDTWLWDGDGDGSYDHASRGSDDGVVPVAIDFPSLHAAEMRVVERTGLRQGERFRAEVEAWTAAGRFVPVDSLRSR